MKPWVPSLNNSVPVLTTSWTGISIWTGEKTGGQSYSIAPPLSSHSDPFLTEARPGRGEESCLSSQGGCQEGRWRCWAQQEISNISQPSLPYCLPSSLQSPPTQSVIIIWAADEQFLGQQIFNLLNSRAQRDLLLKTQSHDERSLTVTLTQLTDSPVCLLLHHTRFE